MGLPVTVYRWDDAGAPVLPPSAKTSDIILMLKKCLVDGYGSKQPLGWTVAFEDTGTFSIVFRNSPVDGSGQYFKLHDEIGNNANNGAKRVYSMYNATGINAASHVGWRRRFIPYSNNTQWVIIGTSVGFYMMLGMSDKPTMKADSALGTGLFIGDIHSAYTNDASRFIVANGAGNADSTGFSWTDNIEYLSNSSNLDRMGDVDGDTSNLQSHVIRLVFSGMGTEGTIANGAPKCIDFYSNVVVANANNQASNDRNGIPLFNSPTRPHIRGVLPGLLHTSAVAHTDTSWPLIKSINGVNHWGFRGRSLVSFYLNMESWYE